MNNQITTIPNIYNSTNKNLYLYYSKVNKKFIIDERIAIASVLFNDIPDNYTIEELKIILITSCNLHTFNKIITENGYQWILIDNSLRFLLVPHVLTFILNSNITIRNINKINLTYYGIKKCKAYGDTLKILRRKQLSTSDVDQIEKRFKIKIPQYYRKFLIDTNGGIFNNALINKNFGFILDQNLLSVEEIETFNSTLYKNKDINNIEKLLIGFVQNGYLFIHTKEDKKYGSIYLYEINNYYDLYESNDFKKISDNFYKFFESLSIIPEYIIDISTKLKSTIVKNNI